MEYKLLTAVGERELSDKVTSHLRNGWTLHGPTNQTTEETWGHFKKSGERTIFSQAVVK
jgi:hypothetical protein